MSDAKKLQRYVHKATYGKGVSLMVPVDSGDWVKHDEAQAEIDRLQSELDDALDKISEFIYVESHGEDYTD